MKLKLALALGAALALCVAPALGQKARPWPSPYLAGAGSYLGGDCLEADSNGNIVDSGSGSCGAGGDVPDPIGVKGINGASIASPGNPLPVQQQGALSATVTNIAPAYQNASTYSPTSNTFYGYPVQGAFATSEPSLTNGNVYSSRVNAHAALYTDSSPLTPLAGTQVGLAITSSTALTVPSGATLAIIQAQGMNAVNGTCLFWRDDGTAPTASSGQGLLAWTSKEYRGNLAAIRLIGATSATCTATISYYN